MIEDIKLQEKQDNLKEKERFVTRASLYEQTNVVYKLKKSSKSRITKDSVISDLRRYGSV